MVDYETREKIFALEDLMKKIFYIFLFLFVLSIILAFLFRYSFFIVLIPFIVMIVSGCIALVGRNYRNRFDDKKRKERLDAELEANADSYSLFTQSYSKSQIADFDYFSVDLPVVFENDWEGSDYASELGISGYDIKAFKNSAAVTYEGDKEYTEVTKTYMKYKYRMKVGIIFCNILYISYGSKKELKSNKYQIMELFDKENLKNLGCVNHYFSDTEHVVVEMHMKELSGKPVIISDSFPRIFVEFKNDGDRNEAKPKDAEPADDVENSNDEVLAVKNTDDAVLAEIAKNSSNDDARKEAIGKIGDVDVLADIALKSTERDIAVAAVRRIDDEDVLAEIAKNAEDSLARSRAFDKIKNVDLRSLIKQYEKDQYLTCDKCGGWYSITGSHYEAQFDWFFYDLACSNCGHTSKIPQHLLDE